MTHDIDGTWFIREYDLFVDETGSDGSELEKSRDAIAHRYADAVERGDISRIRVDLVTEGRDLFDKSVKTTRTRRRNTMKQSMEQLLRVTHGDELLGDDDPILDWSFPLGADDGRDKTLRYWTVEDWQNAWTVRFSNAARASAAADEFYQQARQVVAEMNRRGVNMTGDLADA